MWRPTILRRILFSSIKENITLSTFLYSTKSRPPRSAAKLTLISASVGILVGAGYGGYTHYKINTKKLSAPLENEGYPFFKHAPEYKSHYKVINEADSSNLQLVLFQYQTCPFCCKVRAYLDARGINYEIVEVDAVLRQAIKWSGYKKVPILLAKVDGGYQQLLDSTAILSILETHLRDKSYSLRDIIKFYPVTKYENDSGKPVADVTNKYFIMKNSLVQDEKQSIAELEEREWRQWADRVLVHTLSPNVYRTASEALETFKWFEEAGGWKQSFPSWECAVMVYVGAAAMWIISKKLKARHNIQDDVRQSLYNAVDNWMNVINKKGTPFLGGTKPNLADISVYGILSSIEGCKAFQDLKDNTDVGKWYYNMKNNIKESGGRIVSVQ